MRRFGRWRRGMVVWAAGTSFAVATPASAPSDEDAIATARRDYEAIKAAGAGAEQQKLALPRQELPQLDLKPVGEPATLPTMTARKEEAEHLKKERAGRSPTWLLDAMKEPAGGRAARAEAGERNRVPALAEPGSRADDFLTNAADLTQESERSRSEDNGAVAERKVKADVVNPLSAFMASWMTPRDLELLKPASAGATEVGSGGSLPDPGTVNPAAATTTVAEMFSLRDLARPEAGSISAIDGSKTNPYLSDLAPFAPVAAGPPANLRSPAEPALRMPEAPAPPEQTPTAAPAQPGADLLKARDDEKYFKQLKRF